MNKNTVIAFLIILISINFFMSRFYYEKILRKPYPFGKKQEVVKKESKEMEVSQKQETERPSEIVEKDSQLSIVEMKEEENADTTRTDTVTIDTVWVETDKIICGISEYGGLIISIKTKEFSYNKFGKKKEKNGYIEIVNYPDNGGLNLIINDKEYDKRIFKYEGEKEKIKLEEKEKITLDFSLQEVDNYTITKRFTFSKGTYNIGYKIISDEIKDKKVITGWKCGINESEKIEGRSAQFNRKKIHFYGGESSEHMDGAKEEKIERSGDYNWVAISSKYFAVALIPEKVSSGNAVVEAYYNAEEMKKKKNEREINLSVVFERFCEEREEKYIIYAGPTKIGELKILNVKLEKILFGVSSGIGKFFATIFVGGRVWFPKLCEFVLWLLIQLQKMVRDYGIVIILLTIILRIVTYPLTQTSMKSMNKMKETQPRINKIRERYKGNPKMMNQKIMEFYRNEGINPMGGMGGCLPMVLQMPIMISLFIVLRKAIELRGQGTFLIPWIKDLSQAEVLFPLGFNVPLYGSNVALLPIVMAVLMYFQNKATIKDPNQKAMIYMMPVMMLVLFNNFPSGLCLYFTFSTALQVIQQKIMDKKKAAAAVKK